MATHPEQGGASAPSNIVRLPTAAPRIVRQKCGRGNAFYEAKLACIQFPREFIFPDVRAAMPDAELLADVQRTPALLLAVAILAALPEDVQQRVREELRAAALNGSRTALKAAAFVKPRTFGEQNDLYAAMRRIEEGRL